MLPEARRSPAAGRVQTPLSAACLERRAVSRGPRREAACHTVHLLNTRGCRAHPRLLPAHETRGPRSPVFPELLAGSPREGGRMASAQGACMCAYHVALSGHGAESRRWGHGRDRLCVSVTCSEGDGVWLRNHVGTGGKSRVSDPFLRAVLNKTSETKNARG